MESQQNTPKRKKTYSKPCVVKHGDMREVTKNVGTKGGDGTPSLHSR